MDTPPNFDTPGLPDPQPVPLSEPQAEPVKQRPAWMGWAAAIGAIALVAAGFFGAKALSSKSSANTAGATAIGGNANGNGNGSGGFAGGGRNGTGGTIASISGNTLTVTNPTSNTTTKVVTSSATRVSVAKTVTVGDIATGDRVVVVGTKSGTTVTATRINDTGEASANAAIPDPNGMPGGPGDANAPPGGGQGGQGFGPPGGQPAVGANGGGFTAGTVTSVTSGTIAVKAADGTSTHVKTTAATTVTKNVESSVSALKVGDAVQARGETASDGTVTASSISEGEGGFGFGGLRDGTPGTGS